VYVSTNGCEEAQLSSAYLVQFFRKNGLNITKEATQADLIVFYACGLTVQSEEDSLKVINKLKSKMKVRARLLVWGCLSKINSKILAKVYDGPMIGPKDVVFVEKILERTKIPLANISANELVSLETFRTHSKIELFKKMLMLWNPPTQRTFYIRVATGCTGHCTYCSDRCAWGRICSRPVDKIISEFKRGLKMGYTRFFLVADDLGAYGEDIDCALPDLLGEMIKIDDERNYRVILNQINPFYLKEYFYDLESVFESGKVEMLGCQVQSGSNRILNLMGRAYTVEDWKEYMLRINNKYPNILLSTHFMVGFPTETDEDFKATLNLLNEIFLDDILVFKFSKRPTVYASYYPGQISDAVKEMRYKKLLLKAITNIATRKTQRRINRFFSAGSNKLSEYYPL